MKPSTPARHPTTDNTANTPRKDTHVSKQDSPVGPGINAQTPSSMPRADDDEATRANSSEFHDRPGSGKRTADRQRVF